MSEYTLQKALLSFSEHPCRLETIDFFLRVYDPECKYSLKSAATALDNLAHRTLSPAHLRRWQHQRTLAIKTTEYIASTIVSAGGDL